MGTGRRTTRQQRIVPRWTLLVVASALSMLAIVRSEAAHAQVSGKELGPPSASRALACKLGHELMYDYDGVFISEADVQTVEDVAYRTATLTGRATVSVTAVGRQNELCTHAVRLTDVEVAEIVGDEIVESLGEHELAGVMGDTYYFTQTNRGQIVDLLIGEHDGPEVVTFKRGVVNALNLTLQTGEQYEAVESDISGTYQARYRVSETDEQLTLHRRKQSQDSLADKGGMTASSMVESIQTTRFAIDKAAGCLTEISIDESVVIAQPGAGDPPVSDRFHHEKVTVRAKVDMRLTGARQGSNAPAMKRASLASGMVRIPVADPIVVPDERAEQGAIIDSLLDQLLDRPDHRQLAVALSRAVRLDPDGIAHLGRFMSRTDLPRALARTLGSVLVHEESEAAQALLWEHFFVRERDEETRTMVIALSTTMSAPGSRWVDAIASLAADPSGPHWVPASLALGAYAHTLGGTDATRAEAIVARLVSKLHRATSHADTQIYLRALGNAGDPDTLPLLLPYLRSSQPYDRLAAATALRKIESPEVDEAFLAHYPREANHSVREAIGRTMARRAVRGVSSISVPTKDVLVDWSWEDTFGGNIANATFSASARVEDEPYLVDLQLDAGARVFGFDFDLVSVEFLTEQASAEDRRFRFFVQLGDNEVANLDDTETCSIDGENTVWETSIDLFEFESQPIPVAGPLTLRFTVEGALEFYINFLRAGEWCSNDGNLRMGLAPGVGFYVDGYATLSLVFVRGGVGIDGHVISVDFPVVADAEMIQQNAPTVCFQIDARLRAGDMELYAWGQWRPLFGGWMPDPRPHWTLWSFTLAEVTWNLLAECGGSNPNLRCLQDVLWWDGTIIDPVFDAPNCVVRTPPAGSSPFIASNAYYIEADSDCPEDMPWDGVGCLVDNVSVRPGTSVTLRSVNGLPQLEFAVFGLPLPEIPPCPAGWQNVGMTEDSRTCETTPPPGFSGDDFFLESAGPFWSRLYLDGDGRCIEGNIDRTGCWLGDAPVGTVGNFLANPNLFVYTEP